MTGINELLIVATTLGAATWLRSEVLRAARTPRFNALAFLVVESVEKHPETRQPTQSRYFRKGIVLRIPPVPGSEIDGFGIPATRINRVRIADLSDPMDAFLYLDPISKAGNDIDEYADDLVRFCGWEKLPFDPRSQ